MRSVPQKIWPSQRERTPIHLYEMMHRLGLEPSDGVLPQFSLRYTTALRRCEACPFKNTCRDWLDHAPASIKLAPQFCPDADILFELQFDQLASGRA